MEAILQEIERALKGGYFYLAIVTTLTLPEVCAALETPGGSTKTKSRDSYKAWYEKHLSRIYPMLTKEDCYSLRCGVAHEGKFGRPGELQYARVIFTLPAAHGNRVGVGVLHDALSIDAVEFCENFIKAVRNWFQSAQHDPVVQKNLPLLVQYRPNGIAPYYHGFPVIS